MLWSAKAILFLWLEHRTLWDPSCIIQDGKDSGPEREKERVTGISKQKMTS